MKKNNYYAIFGALYFTKKHPTYDKAHPHGYLRIVAENYNEAHRKAQEVCKPFAFLYNESGFKANAGTFPKGELDVVEA